MENQNWKHANLVVAGAWYVEHVHELNKLPTPHTYIFSTLRWEKENDRGRKCNLTCRRCTRCCKFAQIWHPSPYNYIFRSFEVANEKGRTEEIEFHNLDTTTHNFVFPNLEVGHGKYKLKTRKSDCRRCMRCWTCAWIEQNTDQHRTPTFSRVLRWGKENDRGRKCNLTCRRCTRCCNFAQIWHPSPYNYIFRSFEVGSEKGRTEEIEFDNLDTTTHNFIFPNLEVGHGKKNWKHANQIVAGAWDVEHVQNWTNYQHPTYIFSSFEVGTCRRCTRCCNFAQIWHPSPSNYIFRSFEVGSEKGRTEEIEFDNIYHHSQFDFPEPWSGTWKIKTGNMQIRLPQEHEMLNMCMNWTKYRPTPHTYIFSSFEVGKGKRQSAWDVVILHKYDTPAPTITFSGVLR